MNFSKYVRGWVAGAALGILMAGRSLMADSVHVITVDDAITPVTAKYISDSVDRAEEEGANCLIIELDTPGGLMQSTMTIDKKLLAARVPVVVYISPSGGRAASAGVFITYAAHVAAMAPSTNIGSAHPVNMMGKDSSQTMMEKVTNDAVAHIKGLADKRGRNAGWAETAVRQSVNITEKEALDAGVIDLVASSLYELLHELDGRTVSVDGQETALKTRQAQVIRRPMNWRYRILDKIASPNIAYLLMMGGIIGLFFELQNPGGIFPGVIGGLCIILAGFALQVLPINTAGILLILLSIIFFILEVKTPTFGLLTTGGVVALLFGSLMLFKTPEFRVSLAVIIPTVISMALFFLVVVSLALKAQTRKPATGNKGLVGERGTALGALKPEGQVSLHGEIWKAISSEPCKKGDEVEVERVSGLTVYVKKVGK